MSNRLIQIGRVPLIPDPVVALKASQAFSVSQAQTERVAHLGEAIFGLWSTLLNGISRFGDLLERANQVRNLSTMSDKSLADIGIRRDQLPQLYIGSGVEDLVASERSARSSDRER